MSQHRYYQAIGETSELLQRLLRDPTFHLLFTHLMRLGPGPFHWGTLEASEIGDTLNWLLNRQVLASNAEAEALCNEAHRLVSEAIRDDPQIPGRSAYLEQVQGELAERLRQLLPDRATSDLMTNLIDGGNLLDPNVSEGFRRVPAHRVSKASETLLQLTADVLYPDRDAWDDVPAEDYAAWRLAYLSAAAAGHAMLVLRS
jgi:hypothetical protein